METVHIDNLSEWRKNNPDAKSVMVDHGKYGKVILRFNYVDPKEPSVLKRGAYDGFGNFHFTDEEGTYHLCLCGRNNFIKR